MSQLARVAGAPISWGICEAPGWGRELPRDRVLSDMQTLGLRATELGPVGFLPPEPTELVATLGHYGLRLVAGFVPAVLHRADQVDEIVATTRAEAGRLRQAGADVLVVAAASGARDRGYEQRPVLADEGWARLAEALVRLDDQARAVGIALTVHPHVGTMIERPDEVDHLLEATDAGLCLDTGHLAIGGTDPVELARRVPQRVGHVHLKDVDLDRATAVREGRTGYLDAVRQGLYRPLGQGDVDIAGVITALEKAGYQGWYVLEQDVSLPADGAPRAGVAIDPAVAVRASLEFVREVERQLGTATDPRANVTTARAPT